MTYRQILEALKQLSDEQLDQEAELTIGTYDDVVPLHSVIGFGTVQFYEYEATRSSVDNRHHPEKHIFLCDFNLYAEDGTMGFDLETGERF